MSKNNSQEQNSKVLEQTKHSLFQRAPLQISQTQPYYPFRQTANLFTYPFSPFPPPLPYYGSNFFSYNLYPQLNKKPPAQIFNSSKNNNQTETTVQMVKQEPIDVPILNEEKEKQQFQIKQEEIQHHNRIEGQDLAAMTEEVLISFPKAYVHHLISAFKRIITALADQDVNIIAIKRNCQKEVLQIEGQYTGEKEPFRGQLNAKKSKVFNQLVGHLQEKYHNFKKTKQQLIKYIIRRTYHNMKINKMLYDKPQYERLQHFHQKNLSFHRSMNVNFLKKQFSNQLFLTIYKRFLCQLSNQLEDQNQERIARFSVIMTKCWVKKCIKQLEHERKLPWIASYKVKVKKIAFDLLREYEVYCEQPSNRIIKK